MKIYVSICENKVDLDESKAITALKDAFVIEASADGHEVYDQSMLPHHIALKRLKESNFFVAFIDVNYTASHTHVEDWDKAAGMFHNYRYGYSKKPMSCFIYEVGEDNSRKTIRPGYEVFDGTYRSFCEDNDLLGPKDLSKLASPADDLNETDLAKFAQNHVEVMRSEGFLNAMTLKDQITSIKIQLITGKKSLLHIVLTDNGSVERMGNAGNYQNDYNRYVGKTAPKVFEELKSSVPEAWLSVPPYYEKPNDRSCGVGLIVTLQMTDSEDIVVRYVERQPDEAERFVLRAKYLTDPWFRVQQRKAGIDDEYGEWLDQFS